MRAPALAENDFPRGKPAVRKRFARRVELRIVEPFADENAARLEVLFERLHCLLRFYPRGMLYEKRAVRVVERVEKARGVRFAEKFGVVGKFGACCPKFALFGRAA